MGGIDAMTVMSYNEYDQIINCGINEDELNVFPVSDYGYDIPEDGLYCLKKSFANKKEEISSFLKATMKGWAYAAIDKRYAIDLVTKQMQLAHLPANKVHQEWMLDKMLELINPGKKGGEYGVLQETDFDKAVAVSAKLNGTKPRYSYGEFYYSPLK
jgi:NitT/TauT family transport system substrate-binding protein